MLDEAVRKIVDTLYSESPQAVEEMLRWGLVGNIAVALFCFAALVALAALGMWMWKTSKDDHEAPFVWLVIISLLVGLGFVSALTDAIKTQVAPRSYVADQVRK